MNSLFRTRADDLRLARLAAVFILGFALILSTGGCVGPTSDTRLRDELRAFADTSSARVARLCDDIARETDDMADRARLNGEKIRTANMGIENASHPDAMTGLLDMAFQFEIKARKAKDRVERLREPTAKQREPSLMDKYADVFLEVHEKNSSEIWEQAKKQLTPDQLVALRTMIAAWYKENGETERSSVRIAELKSFAGSDPIRMNAVSLVDLRESNEQMDRLVWMAQKMYENSHWQVRQFIYDIVKEIERPRNESIAVLTDALLKARDDTVAYIAPWLLILIVFFTLLNGATHVFIWK